LTKHHFESREMARTEELAGGEKMTGLVVDVVEYAVVEMVEKLVILWVLLVLEKEEVGGDGGVLVEREMEER